MTSYKLREGLYTCIADNQAAFLDVAADRYFALPSLTQAAFIRLATQGIVEPEQEKALIPLLRSGVLVPCQKSAFPIPASLLPRPRYSLTIPHGTAAHIGDTMGALLAQLSAMTLLKSCRLKTTLSISRKCKPLVSQSLLPPPCVLRAFMVTRRIIATQDRCLRWSLAMSHYLAHLGFHSQLVIGVQMAPFAAHAWVQAGETVLSDDVDNVRRYTPIVVI